MSIQKKSLITQRNSVKKAIMAKPERPVSVKPAARVAVRAQVAAAVGTKVSASNS